MAQTTIQKKKKVSPKLNKILNTISGLFGKLNVQVELAFKVGKEEGFSENEIAHLVRQKMKEAGYGYTRIWQVLKETHPNVIQQGHKSFHKPKTSSVTKAEKPFNALGLVKKAMSGLASTDEVKPRKSRFDELEEEEEAEANKQKHKVKYELEPEEKELDELLVWESDLVDFPPDSIIKICLTVN